jgi:hypothetical protein
MVGLSMRYGFKAEVSARDARTEVDGKDSFDDGAPKAGGCATRSWAAIDVEDVHSTSSNGFMKPTMASIRPSRL